MQVWKRLGNRKKIDLRKVLSEEHTPDHQVYIGTDSIQIQKNTQFVSVVILYKHGLGGAVFYTREVVPRIASLQQRLVKEVWLSLSVAMAIQDICPNPEIHIDANPKERHNSSKYVKELVGMVLGNGFRVAIKPDAWAATTAADFIVRHGGGTTKGMGKVVNIA